MEILGSLERFVGDLYPYRYAIGATAVALVIALAFVAWWRGWHRVAARRPWLTLGVAVGTLAVAIPLGNYLLSPLWTRTTLVEESPLAALASNPLATRVATSTPAARDATTRVASMAPTSTPQPMAPTTAPTEPPSGGEPGDDMPTATPAQAAPTETPLPPEPTATSPPEPTATEIPPTPEPVAFEPRVVLTGEFYGADDFHFGRGTALIIQVEPSVYVLRFEDFSVRNGPDLRVYLSTNPDGYSANDYEIGPLRATDGSFNYDIPPDVDISLYRSVIIWCEPFAVLFAVAPLLGE